MQTIPKKAEVMMAESESEEDADADASSNTSVESASGGEDGEGGENSKSTGNAGWADSMAKVLKTTKPKKKKTLVLSRAKKFKAGEDEKKKTQPDYDFEVEGADSAKSNIKSNLSEHNLKDEKSSSKSKKNVPLALRTKPNWQDLDRERTLRKVATRGVVQLFNAVRIEQKDLQQQLADAGPLDSRKDAILNNINKRKFLDVLMGGKRSKSEAIDNSVKNEMKDESESDDDDNGNKNSEWNVLRSDYMTNKKIKHWDEEEDDDDDDDDRNTENESSEADEDVE